MKKDLKKTIFSRIQQEKISPISKYIFIIKRSLIYISLLISLIIGAFSFSLMLGYISHADWDLLQKLGFWKLLFIFLPYFWLISLMLSLCVGYIEFKNTSRGYKFYLWQILLGNIFLSCFLGIIFFYSGFSYKGEQKIDSFIPYYREILVKDRTSRIVQVWQNEEKGLLLGSIISLQENFFYIEDSNKHVWKITLYDNGVTNIKQRVTIQPGKKIKIIGIKMDSQTFSAQEIRPFFRDEL